MASYQEPSLFECVKHGVDRVHGDAKSLRKLLQRPCRLPPREM